MKRYIAFLLTGLLLIISSCRPKDLSIEIPSGATTFLILSDAGAMGSVRQHRIARKMDSIAALYKPAFIVSNGDLFHDSGLPSLSNKTILEENFLNVYNLPHLQIPWMGVIGNHEYFSDPDTLLALNRIFPHWEMSKRYDTRSFVSNDSCRFRLIFLDTSPYKESYRKRPEMAQVLSVDTDRQTQWADSVLSVAKEPGVIVFGHHPLRTGDWGHGNTSELIDRFESLFEQRHITAYFSGHIHNFEHTRRGGIDYFRTSTGGNKTRIATPWFGTRFYDSQAGFTLCAIAQDTLSVYFIAETGEVIYHTVILFPPQNHH